MHLNPEQIHLRAIDCLELAGKFPTVHRFISRQVKRPEERFTWSLDSSGRKTSGPLSLAARIDKETRVVPMWDVLSFGFVKIGIITPLTQPSNERPHLWRMPVKRALRDAMGLSNEGARKAARRLRRLRVYCGDSLIIGADIGKNKVTPPEKAPSDYREVTRNPVKLVDLLVINVSPPNTPGSHDLQAMSSLEPIIQVVQTELTEQNLAQLPVFAKIAPSLANDNIMAVAKLAEQSNLAGVVATNTTIQHDLGQGGVSEEPLHERTLEVATLLCKHLSPKKTIIGVGGITITADAQTMLDAGANLAEEFSAFIYEGPGWAAWLNRQLASAARS